MTLGNDASSARPLRILHVIVSLGPSNAQYNEHCLPMMHDRDITICSFTRAQIRVPTEITAFEGDGSLRGFLRVLRRALDERSYDIIHAHAPGTGAAVLLANLMGRTSMSRTVYTVHNSFKSFRLRSQFLMLPVVARFPNVVFCSHAALESAPRLVRMLAGSNTEVIQNGVHTERIRHALAGFDEAKRTTGTTIAAVGRLIPRKDPLTLLEAFGLCGSWERIVYIGDGLQRGTVLREAAKRGLGSRVSVTGTVQRDEVYRRLARCDVLVSTSHSEGLPVAVLEGMACGRPVILSDIPPHQEIATGVDFIPLVRPGDAEGFARELRALREMTSEQRVEVGERCRDLAESRFSLPAMHRSYGRVYARVSATRRSKERFTDRARAEEGVP